MKEGPEFSQEETALMLGETPFDKFPEATAERLERLGLETFVDLFPRNLGVLLSQRE